MRNLIVIIEASHLGLKSEKAHYLPNVAFTFILPKSPSHDFTQCQKWFQIDVVHSTNPLTPGGFDAYWCQKGHASLTKSSQGLQYHSQIGVDVTTPEMATLYELR